MTKNISRRYLVRYFINAYLLYTKNDTSSYCSDRRICVTLDKNRVPSILQKFWESIFFFLLYHRSSCTTYKLDLISICEYVSNEIAQIPKETVKFYERDNQAKGDH